MSILLECLSYCLSLVGPRCLDCLARLLTFLCWDLFRIRRKIILENLGTAFGTEKSRSQRLALGRLSVYHFALTILEFLSERGGKLGSQVSIVEGEEHLQRAISKGNGAYILCIHLGNWEAMGAGLAFLGYPSHTVVKKVGAESMDCFVRKRRSDNGFHCIERRTKGSAIKGIIRTLRKGQLVGFIMDQARPGSPLLPFFGRPAKTNTSFAAIHRSFPAPIIPIFIKRTSVHQHEIYVKKPLQLIRSEDSAKDILQHSCQFNLVIESMIRKCPEQYFWMHNRWKA